LASFYAVVNAGYGDFWLGGGSGVRGDGAAGEGQKIES